MNRYVTFILLTSVILLFQNCQKMTARNFNEGLSKVSSFDDPYEKIIRSTNKIFPSTNEIIFYVNPMLFNSEADYRWNKSTDSGVCFSEAHESKNAVKIICTQPGTLSLSLNVINPDSTIDSLSLDVDISDGSFLGDLSDSELYYHEDQLTVRIDGSIPGQIDNPAGPSISGSELYVRHCQSCHSDLNSSDVKNASSSLISNRISNLPVMNHLFFLTPSEINAIAEALK